MASQPIPEIDAEATKVCPEAARLGVAAIQLATAREFGCCTQRAPSGTATAAGLISGGAAACAVAQMGHKWRPFGWGKSQVAHMGDPQTSHVSCAATDGCCTQTAPSLGSAGGTFDTDGAAKGCRVKRILYSPPWVAHRAICPSADSSGARHSGHNSSTAFTCLRS